MEVNYEQNWEKNSNTWKLNNSWIIEEIRGKRKLFSFWKTILKNKGEWTYELSEHTGHRRSGIKKKVYSNVRFLRKQ